METAGLCADETWEVQYFSAMETSCAVRDGGSVWEHVGLMTASFRSVSYSNEIVELLHK